MELKERDLRKAYSVGKLSPLRMPSALIKLHCRREETAIIGERMDKISQEGLNLRLSLTLFGVVSQAPRK